MNTNWKIDVLVIVICLYCHSQGAAQIQDSLNDQLQNSFANKSPKELRDEKSHFEINLGIPYLSVDKLNLQIIGMVKGEMLTNIEKQQLAQRDTEVRDYVNLIKLLESNHDLLKSPSVSKDEFETTAQYEARKASEKQQRQKIQTERDRIQTQLKSDTVTKAARKFEEHGTPVKLGLKITSINYDADQGIMTCKIDSKYYLSVVLRAAGISLPKAVNCELEFRNAGLWPTYTIRPDYYELNLYIADPEKARKFKDDFRIRDNNIVFVGTASVRTTLDKKLHDELSEKGSWYYNIDIHEIDNIELAEIGDVNSLGIKWQLPPRKR